ncbi:MAG: hypothetical protein HYU70_17735 [Bacteroidetes bacterium]|nr:hypothetical protein [Bacteroidota bacterium]
MKETKSWYLPFVIVFVLVSVASFLGRESLATIKISWPVVMGANLLLFLFAVLNIFAQLKTIAKAKPAAVIRGVMLGTFLKLIGLAVATVIYLVVAGPARSKNAIFVGMGLYFVYTWLEVRISLRMKSQP